MSFQNLQPKIINYRDYITFDIEKFRSDIWKINLNTNDLQEIKKTVICIFNKDAPIKRKHIHTNVAPFITTDLHKAIMERSKLRNAFLKSRALFIRKIMHHKGIFVKNTKRTYFNNSDINKVTDNRTFWKSVVPLFFNKFSKSQKMNLTDGNKTISNDNEPCRVFNTFRLESS